MKKNKKKISLDIEKNKLDIERERLHKHIIKFMDSLKDSKVTSKTTEAERIAVLAVIYGSFDYIEGLGLIEVIKDSYKAISDDVFGDDDDFDIDDPEDKAPPTTGKKKEKEEPKKTVVKKETKMKIVDSVRQLDLVTEN